MTHSANVLIPIVFGEPIEFTYSVYASLSGGLRGAAAIDLAYVMDGTGKAISATFEPVQPAATPNPRPPSPTLIGLAAAGLAAKRQTS